VEAVTGKRIIPVRLFRDINIAGNVMAACKILESDDWAKWAQDNPELTQLLERARLEYEQ